MINKKLRVASLFAGAGGLDLGFRRADFQIIWANDNEKDACATYMKNLGQHIVCDDIENINLSKIPSVDVIIGGFPCQGFSVANMGRSIDDSRNVLYKTFVAAVAKKQPKYFLAENVKGILSLAKGEVFRSILREFAAQGYACRCALVNSADYGVPQCRERVFIWGVRKDLDSIEFDFPPEKTHELRHVSVSEALKNIPDPDKKHDLTNHIYSTFKLKFNGYIGHRTINPHKPSPTITARGDKRGGAVIIHHPNNTRRMTCREAALIQGFPLDYRFEGAMTSVYRQIGNAVPSQLAEAIAVHIKKHWQEIQKKAVCFRGKIRQKNPTIIIPAQLEALQLL